MFVVVIIVTIIEVSKNLGSSLQEFFNIEPHFIIPIL